MNQKNFEMLHEIAGSTISGIILLLTCGAAPVVRCNEIRHGRVGVRCEGGTQALLENNLLMYNTQAAIYLHSDDGSRIQENSIKENVECGVILVKTRRARIVANEICKNSTGILIYEDDSQPESASTISEGWSEPESVHIEENTIFGNEHYGIFATYGAVFARVAKNTIKENTVAGVRMEMWCRVHFVENVIDSNFGHGVLVSNHGCGFIYQNCIQENRGHGILVENAGSPEMIRDNQIRSNRRSGIALQGAETQCTFVHGNTLQFNREVQIYVGDAIQKVHIASNLIEDGIFGGVQVCSNATGNIAISENTISRNQNWGIRVSSGADPMIVENHILDTQGNGVLVEEVGLGTFIKNRIHSSQRHNIRVATAARPVFRENKLCEAEGYGALYEEGGAGLFEQNVLDHNFLGGICLRSRSEPHIIRNDVRNTATGSGIESSGGGGLVEFNRVTSNFQSGLLSRMYGSTLFARNEIVSENQCGILICNYGTASFEDNLVTLCKEAGIRIEGTRCRANVRRNRILKNKHGIVIMAQVEDAIEEDEKTVPLTTTGTVQNNEIRHNSECGVVVGGNVELQVDHNTIEQNEQDGVHITGVSNAVNEDVVTVIVNNDIARNKGYGIHIRNCSCSQARLEQNNVSHHHVNVVVTHLHDFPPNQYHSPVLHKNRIANASEVGCRILSQGTSEFVENEITENPCGVLITEEGRGTFIKNIIHHNTHQGVMIQGMKCRPIFERNEIHSCPIGIRVEQYTEGEFTANHLHKLTWGIQSLSYAMSKWVQNKCTHCSSAGLHIFSHGGGQFIQNRFSEHEHHAVIIEEGNAPILFEKNFIAQNSHGSGVQIQAQGHHSIYETNLIVCREPEQSVFTSSQSLTLNRSNSDAQLIARSVASSTLHLREDGQTTRLHQRTLVIQENDISHNQNGLVTCAGCSPNVLRNTIHDNNECGVILESSAAGYYGHNRVEKNKHHGLHIRSHAHPELEQNIFCSGNGTGLHCDDNAGGSILRNTFVNNALRGIVIEGCGEDLVFEENQVGQNGICGIQVVSNDVQCRSRPLIQRNLFDAKILENLRNADDPPSESHFLEASGVGSDPLVRNNTFQRGSTGLLLQDGAQGRYEENVVRDFTRAGVCILDEATAPRIYLNEIQQNNIGCLITSGVRQEGSEILLNNVFDGNTQCGISLECSSSILMVGNVFLNHRMHAIRVSGEGTRNIIRGNVFCPDVNDVAILITLGAHPRIENNKFVRLSRYGIHIIQSGRGHIRENIFCSNVSCGLCIEDNGDPLVECNILCHHMKEAIHVSSSGRGKFENNDIRRNAIGINLSSTASAHFFQNYIHENTSRGIEVRGVCPQLLVEQNCFEHNTELDAFVGLESNEVTFRKNVFLGCVMCHGLGHADFDGNVFSSSQYLSTRSTVTRVSGSTFEEKTDLTQQLSEGNMTMSPSLSSIVCTTGFGVDIRSSASPSLRSNVFCGLAVAVLVQEDGFGNLVDNMMFECQRGIEVVSGGKPQVSTNWIKRSKESGIVVRDKGMGNFYKNVISSSQRNGITVLHTSTPHIQENKIHQCTSDGIYCCGEGCAPYISKNDIVRCRYNIRVVAFARPEIRENNIYDGSVGVLVTSDGCGMFVENNIFDNDQCGFSVEGTAGDPQLIANRISSPTDNGAADIDMATKTVLRQNVIRNQFSPVFQKGLQTRRSRIRNSFDQVEKVRFENVHRIMNETNARLNQVRGLVEKTILTMSNSRTVGLDKKHFTLGNPIEIILPMTSSPFQFQIESIRKLLLEAGKNAASEQQVTTTRPNDHSADGSDPINLSIINAKPKRATLRPIQKLLAHSFRKMPCGITSQVVTSVPPIHPESNQNVKKDPRKSSTPHIMGTITPSSPSRGTPLLMRTSSSSSHQAKNSNEDGISTPSLRKMTQKNLIESPRMSITRKVLVSKKQINQSNEECSKNGPNSFAANSRGPGSTRPYCTNARTSQIHLVKTGEGGAWPPFNAVIKKQRSQGTTQPKHLASLTEALCSKQDANLLTQVQGIPRIQPVLSKSPKGLTGTRDSKNESSKSSLPPLNVFSSTSVEPTKEDRATPQSSLPHFSELPGKGFSKPLAGSCEKFWNGELESIRSPLTQTRQQGGKGLSASFANSALSVRGKAIRNTTPRGTPLIPRELLTALEVTLHRHSGEHRTNATYLPLYSKTAEEQTCLSTLDAALSDMTTECKHLKYKLVVVPISDENHDSLSIYSSQTTRIRSSLDALSDTGLIQVTYQDVTHCPLDRENSHLKGEDPERSCLIHILEEPWHYRIVLQVTVKDVWRRLSTESGAASSNTGPTSSKGSRNLGETAVTPRTKRGVILMMDSVVGLGGALFALCRSLALTPHHTANNEEDAKRLFTAQLHSLLELFSILSYEAIEDCCSIAVASTLLPADHDLIISNVRMSPYTLNITAHDVPHHLIYVICIPSMQEKIVWILKEIIRRCPSLQYAFSCWHETKSGKAYNAWIREGHRNAAHVLGFFCGSYVQQQRCEREYRSLAYHSATILMDTPMSYPRQSQGSDTACDSRGTPRNMHDAALNVWEESRWIPPDSKMEENSPRNSSALSRRESWKSDCSAGEVLVPSFTNGVGETNTTRKYFAALLDSMHKSSGPIPCPSADQTSEGTQVERRRQGESLSSDPTEHRKEKIPLESSASTPRDVADGSALGSSKCVYPWDPDDHTIISCLSERLIYFLQKANAR